MRYFVRNWGCKRLAFKSEYTAMATVLAAVSGLLFAVLLWFVFTSFFSLEARLAAAIASCIGGIEYFVLRYILSQKYIKSREET